jgi:hypothetical protein
VIDPVVLVLIIAYVAMTFFLLQLVERFADGPLGAAPSWVRVAFGSLVFTAAFGVLMYLLNTGPGTG